MSKTDQRGKSMKRLAALLPMALALGAIISVPGAGAREPTKIKACQTISQPGSYELADNLASTGDCLVITTDAVTVDLAGFTIRGPGGTAGGAGIVARPSSGQLGGIAVRNGSISHFFFGVDLTSAHGSVVEGLRVFNGFAYGIIATGIVKGNTVVGIDGGIGIGIGIVATGIVTGNYASDNRVVGIQIGQGSTVIGNTALGNFSFGIGVSCPSNLTDNTAVNNTGPPGDNLVLQGDGCHNEDNVAP
jgi:hypothetical protein